MIPDRPLRMDLAIIFLLYALGIGLLVNIVLEDWHTSHITDYKSYILQWSGLLGAVFGHLPISPENAVLGAVVGYLSFFCIALVYSKIRNRLGLGDGDFLLLSALGAWVGVTALPYLVLVASLLGIVYKLSQKSAERAEIPFAPFLAAGGVLVFLAQVFDLV